MTSVSFPLYDTVLSGFDDFESIKNEPVDRSKLVKNIHALDQDGKNKVYALIRYYDNQKQEEEPSYGLPFNGQFIENELIFDLEHFPNPLQHILMEFTRIHLKHMKYAQKIEKIRKKTT